MSTTYEVRLGWNAAEVQETTSLTASDFQTACIEARRGWGKSWSSVVVIDAANGVQVDVAWHRTHGDMSPEEWVTRRLAPPAEVPIVSIDAFLGALQPQIVGFPGPTENRPVWIKLDDMLYAPAQIGLDAEFGGIIIIPSDAPSARHDDRGGQS